MKAKSFFTSLRKVIREEVQLAVRTEIQNVIKGNTEPVVEQRKNVGYNLADQVRTSMGSTPPRVDKLPDVEYSSNPMVNSILNETAKQYTQPKQAAPQQEEYPTMGGKPFDSGDLASMLGYGNMPSMQSSTPAIQHMVPKGVNPETVPQDVSNALTRDYSKLMKAIDKKKGIK